MRFETANNPENREVDDKVLNDFYGYVNGFYGDGGIYGEPMYPFKFTKAEIVSATWCCILTNELEFVGDTFDRENVRDIVLKLRGIKL